MIIEHKIDMYLGVVTNTIKQDSPGTLVNPGDDLEDRIMADFDANEHVAIVAIPGIYEHLRAFPERGEVDEPKIGDKVMVYVWDPVYNSYITYRKLKENDIVGFRAHGKMVDITHDKILIGVFDEKTEYKDDERPDCSALAHVEITSEGAITVHAAEKVTVNADSDVEVVVGGNCNVTVSGDSKVDISGNADLKVGGNTKIDTSGNTDIKSGGNCNVESPNVTITGGILNVDGTVAPMGQGALCAVPFCIFSGAPHSGKTASGT